MYVCMYVCISIYCYIDILLNNMQQERFRAEQKMAKELAKKNLFCGCLAF